MTENADALLREDHVVVAPDGARIAAGVMGSGAPLLLVHGAIGDRTSFRLLGPLLADRFTVYSVDRRGHGASTDGRGPYAIDLEFADIAALADSIGGAVGAVGHSFGATVILGAATLSPGLGPLVLYEPSPGIVAAPEGFADRLDSLVEAGLREEALALALTEFAGFGPDELAAYKTSPLWASRVAAAHTIGREVRAEEAFVPNRRMFRRLEASILFLLGSESPDWAERGAAAIARVVPSSRTARLSGQGHMATVTAPELLAEEIAGFLAR